MKPGKVLCCIFLLVNLELVIGRAQNLAKCGYICMLIEPANRSFAII